MVVEINAEKYAQVIQKETCLVVLGSTWCKDCVKIEPFLKELSEEYPKVAIYKIDSRKEEDLSAKLNIRAIPTLIFYHQGKEVGERLVEPQSKDLIENEIKKLSKECIDTMKY